MPYPIPFGQTFLKIRRALDAREPPYQVNEKLLESVQPIVNAENYIGDLRYYCKNVSCASGPVTFCTVPANESWQIHSLSRSGTLNVAVAGDLTVYATLPDAGMFDSQSTSNVLVLLPGAFQGIDTAGNITLMDNNVVQYNRPLLLPPGTTIIVADGPAAASGVTLSIVFTRRVEV